MIDREKVLDALMNCLDTPKCRDCPWEACEQEHETVTVPLDLLRDALALLKEQEPVKPEAYMVANEYTFYRCPACKIGWHYKYDYCPHCGRAVKWDA